MPSFSQALGSSVGDCIDFSLFFVLVIFIDCYLLLDVFLVLVSFLVIYCCLISCYIVIHFLFSRRLH